MRGFDIRYRHDLTRGFNILCQIMVTFLSYISNVCHSLSGVAERLQHTVPQPQELIKLNCMMPSD